MTKAQDAQTGILPGQEPDGGRIFLFFYIHQLDKISGLRQRKKDYVF